MALEKPYRLFCCSAREDEEFVQKLKRHLIPLESGGSITVQADMDIPLGTNREKSIYTSIAAANVILLLISADFMASEYCFNKAIQEAITRHKQGIAYVIPVVVRPTDWQRTHFGDLQSLPKDGLPISIWENIDNAILSVIREIRTIILDFPPNPKQVIPSLEKGAKALLNGDYPSARKLLRIAVDEIAQENQSREASKAYYLLALALLEGKLPRTQGRAIMQSINGLMENAIRLYPSCASYYRIFALIKKDSFERKGYDTLARLCTFPNQ